MNLLCIIEELHVVGVGRGLANPGNGNQWLLNRHVRRSRPAAGAGTIFCSVLNNGLFNIMGIQRLRRTNPAAVFLAVGADVVPVMPVVLARNRMRHSDGERIVVAARMDFGVAYFTRTVVESIDNGGADDGVIGIPSYPEDAAAIIGMSPTQTELEESGTIVSGSGNSGRPLQILTSTAPFIGPGYEPHYEPAPTS
jgi:hypothetical protein